MKYIIMCGGNYNRFDKSTPKQLYVCNGERVVDRTIRLLKDNGVTDIYISTDNPQFESCGVPLLSNPNNKWIDEGTFKERHGYYLDCYYPMDEPCCYLPGDVFYSDAAIKTIVETDCDEFRMFGNVVEVEGTTVTLKHWDEPLGFKVRNQDKFKQAIKDLKEMWDNSDPRLHRHPISWELYRYLSNFPDLHTSRIDSNFTNINDYSTDIDHHGDVSMIESYLKKLETIHKYPHHDRIIGIVSWLPDDNTARKLRKERLNRAFAQIKKVFPDTPIMVISQNWYGYKAPCEIIQYDYTQGLGILKARQTLVEEFRKLDCNYLIMFDDDAIIEYSEESLKEYNKKLEDNPNGFMFMSDENGHYYSAQLNLCAISKYILDRENIVDIDANKHEGYEDLVMANYLHYKYPEYEIKSPQGIRCVQMSATGEAAPSTWWVAGVPGEAMSRTSMKVIDYIKEHKEFPTEEVNFIRDKLGYLKIDEDKTLTEQYEYLRYRYSPQYKKDRIDKIAARLPESKRDKFRNKLYKAYHLE